MSQDFKEYNEDVSNALWRDSNDEEITTLRKRVAEWREVAEENLKGMAICNQRVAELEMERSDLIDVVRDAERLEWLMRSGRMVICDRDGCYTYTHTSGRYGHVAKTQREAIDLAMAETR